MRLLRGALAVALSYALGVSPVLAQVESVRVAAPAAGAPVAAGAAALGSAGAVQPLSVLSVSPLTSFAPALAAPSAAPTAAPAAVPLAAPALAVPAEAASAPSAAAPSALSAVAPAPSRAAARLTSIRAAADKAAAGLDKASGDRASGQASAQFAALAGERLAAPSAGDEVEAPSARAFADAPARAFLDKPSAPAEGAPKAEPPAPKPGLFTVFRDPARNKAFWRYVSGYSIFLLGFEMYVVGLPYLISSMTTNALKEKHDARAANAEAVKELIRSNRSLSRIAHWTAQAFSYALIPLFTKNQETDGPKKWLVRSMLIRAVVLGAVPVLFFSTGILGLQASMWLLFGLIAAQSFFQGISVTTEGAGTTRLLGDKSVTTEERTKANSILNVIGAVLAIVGPVVAGQIALIGPVFGKAGVGGAVIYAIYAGAIALTGLIYATIKIFGGPGKDAGAAPAGATAAAPAPRTLGGTLKTLWASIKDGTRIVLKDRLLRTMLLMSTVSSLFSDPLVFNVLPEYVENLAAHSAGTLGAIMHVPVLGWFLKTLTASGMGNFALMVAMASVGSIAATALMKPLTRLFQRLGFKTDEALTIPFYFIAALEAPLFFLMIHTPTMLGAVALYGLQSLVVGFIGLAISGLYQKNLGGQKDENVNKILAADSLFGIIASIISTFVYGFLLKDIAIGTALLIAAIATGAVSALRLAAPFLSFTRAQRRPPSEPPPPGPVPPAHAKPSTGDHHGPNSILSTQL